MIGCDYVLCKIIDLPVEVDSEEPLAKNGKKKVVNIWAW